MDQIKIEVKENGVIVRVNGVAITSYEFKALRVEDVMLFLLGHLTSGLRETLQRERELAKVLQIP